MSTESEAPSGPKPSRGQSRGRSAAVWIVLVIAGLLLFLSSFAIWTNRVALNTTVFADTSSSLLGYRKTPCWGPSVRSASRRAARPVTSTEEERPD